MQDPCPSSRPVCFDSRLDNTPASEVSGSQSRRCSDRCSDCYCNSSSSSTGGDCRGTSGEGLGGKADWVAD